MNIRSISARKIFYPLLSFFIFGVSLLVAIYIAYTPIQAGYEKLYYLPLLFGSLYFVSILILREKIINLFMFVFLGTSFLRYVILPFLITSTSYYGGRSNIPPTSSSLDYALQLMVYELVIVWLFITISFKVFLKLGNVNLTYPKNHFVYILFIGVSIVSAFLFPSSLNGFSFGKIIVSKTNIYDSAMGNLITYVLVISKYLAFVLIMSYLSNLYNKRKQKKVILIAFMVVIVSILLVFGNNRMDYVITTIVTVVFFYKLFSKRTLIFILPLIFVGIFITSSITEQRNYMTATNGQDPLTDLAETLQVYLAGPYNVAIAIEAKKVFSQEIHDMNIFYEIFRSTIGFNVFLKNMELKTGSEIFNERIYYSDHVSQILPMIGQGVIYLGIVLSPLLSLMFISLAIWLMNIRNGSSRVELLFFLSIAIARLGLVNAQNGAILANDISFFLFLFLIIYFLNDKVSWR
ncbi:oligosaccharide repeat unit polymerase [Edaphobacillus lindanitolerans]|uniref:Oligosaccharide repeat unit polymerase n=1 Tax=Edaphobacillus lindanitolerans TaxID=550447 RepID=A0A1U7PNL3_9BACI|nr:oligosaccharide repeat unit polymerase [Edaphobacillus lindanitolerans]SIT73643.1 hypothetical protein SAMN05428946_1008 [Edaphobacillus lindanitolerans]